MKTPDSLNAQHARGHHYESFKPTWRPTCDRCGGHAETLYLVPDGSQDEERDALCPDCAGVATRTTGVPTTAREGR